MRARTLLPLLLLLCPIAFARQQTARPVSPPRGYETEFSADLDEVQQKLVGLAGAIPADKYGWRPGTGVRSVSEVFMHVAGGNYFLASFIGATAPDDIPADMEKITDKKEVLAQLQRSFTWLHGVVKAIPPADLDKSVMMYGKPTTVRAVLNTILNHLHEHLGQSIAYARMNGVVPPWSR